MQKMIMFVGCCICCCVTAVTKYYIFFEFICIQCPEATVAPRFGGFSFNESAELSPRPLIPSMYFLAAPSDSRRPAKTLLRLALKILSQLSCSFWF